MGFLRLAFILALVPAGIFFAVINIPILEDFDPVPYTPNLPSHLEGPLTPDGHLDKIEKLYENEVLGPESLALSPNGDIYTGGYDGAVRKLSNNRSVVVARHCTPSWDEPACGRILGMRFDNKGTLHFLDPYHGYFQMDIKTGNVVNVLPSTMTVEGYPLTGLDDLEFGKDVIYFSQFSLKYQFKDFLLSLMEHENTGRLLQYNLKTKEITVLARNLSFPNGIQLSKDGTNLMVAESTQHRILKFNLAERKLSVLVDQLPGEPDNIRPSKSGGFWVALNCYRVAGSFYLMDLTSSFPRVRQFVIKLLFLTTTIIEKMAEICSSSWFLDLAHMVSNPRFLVGLEPQSRGMIVKFDETGKIIKSHATKKGDFSLATEVLELDGELYMGSWKNPFIARVALT